MIDKTEVEATLKSNVRLSQIIAIPVRLANGLGIQRRFQLKERTSVMPISVLEWMAAQPKYRAMFTDDTLAQLEQDEAEVEAFDGEELTSETPEEPTPPDDTQVDQNPDEHWKAGVNTGVLKAYARRHLIDIDDTVDREGTLVILRDVRGAFEDV